MVDFKDIKVKILEETDNSGIFEISPLPRGYGHTLTNALRRILLSSIQGSAVTSVRIQGVDHEYSTIDGIKEDVVEIILNIKNIKFKSSSDDPQACTIDLKGDRVITAADIKVPGGIEVMNPDQHIATLTTKDAAISMELVVEKGFGYKEASQSERSELGRIPIDADFTPISLVSVNVVSARKGNETDLDGGVIELVTDGSISPSDALLDASKTLQDFSGKVMAALGVPIKEVEESAEASQVIEEEIVEETGLSDEVSGWKIEDLPISKRSKSGLLAGGYQSIGDLKDLTSSDLLSLPGFGNKSLNEVVELLNQYGIELKA
jgi:DNA-directed RNA polymerase subunit alpha